MLSSAAVWKVNEGEEAGGREPYDKEVAVFPAGRAQGDEDQLDRL